MLVIRSKSFVIDKGFQMAVIVDAVSKKLESEDSFDVLKNLPQI